MEFKHKKLANGLNIVAEVNKDAQSAAVGFFAKTGPRDETDEINGVSHFLEHMLFKGTDKLSAHDVNRTFDDLGAFYNAETGDETTIYYAATLPKQLEEVAKLWCQLMRPALRNDDFIIEKNVILEEIAMYQDLPDYDVHEICKALHFSDHPCGKIALGTVESIKALTSSQMREYFESRYAPNNITVVITGNFEFEKICACIESLCGSWKPKQAGRKTEYFAGTAKREHQKRKNLNCLHIGLMNPTVSYQDERAYAATLLAKIIGDSTGSRFFWELVDTAIAETASMHCEAMDGVGVFYSSIRADRKNGSKVMQIVEKIFKSLQKEKISADELQKAKNKVLSAITIKNEIPMGRLLELGVNWVYLGQYRPIEDEIQRVKNVTLADIQNLIEQFPLANFTQFSIGPE
ncbi:MAG: insulinase family protein [Planctomycetes bacterium]|nr:insulinase family protein [Planctomycetota bacterium]MBU1518903.1 insulinase family protein [Planctomycetota bacterium]MBU2457139.1 insulinase family protein [Planctomycetota bacterium]